MRLNLPIHSYQLRSRPASSARLINCYAEAMPPDAKSPVIIRRAPGVKTWTTAGTGHIVGMHAAHGYLYVVSGSELYRIDAGKAAVLLGDVGTPGNIDIDSNKDSLVVVNEPLAYYWDGSTFAQISDADFTSRGAGDVEFIDNFMLFREPDSDRIFGSDVGSVTSYDALQFANTDANPDNLNGLKADHRQAICAGPNAIEIFQNTGASGFPFERAINGFVQQGCLVGKTLQKCNQSVHWLADDYTVRRLEGLTPVRISTHSIEQMIADSTYLSASAFSYSQDGHIFYVLTVPEGAFVYDATTGEWHERQSYGKNLWSIRHHAQAFGLNLVGNEGSNAIGVLDPVTYDEFGDVQRMEWTYQPVYADGLLAFHKRLEVRIEAGVGLTTGQGSDPQIMGEASDDGGRTWYSLPNRSIGKTGEYRNRVVWHGLGSARERVYRMAISDPVKAVVTDTLLEVEGGRL